MNCQLQSIDRKFYSRDERGIENLYKIDVTECHKLYANKFNRYRR